MPLRQAELRCSDKKKPMLLGVKANGAIKGRLMVMTLEQCYRNTSDKNAEIIYTFPLPAEAVLLGIEVELNGKLLHGEVTARKKARAKYEEAISDGNSGVMLEKNPDGSFTLELGNLLPREECRIMVRYSQILRTEHGQVRMMLPTTIAPRYGDPIVQGKMQPHQVPVTDLMAEYPFDISLTLMGDMAYSNVSSPSHKTQYLRNKEDLVIRLAQRGNLDRDFILVMSNLLSTSDALLCQDACVQGQSAVQVYFTPEFDQAADLSAYEPAMRAKILVDCSGSMAGDSIEAARRALVGIVGRLTGKDRFSLSRFGSSYEHRSRGMWKGSLMAKASALRWVEKLDADLGGTEMANALLSTVNVACEGAADVLLITDGQIDDIGRVIEVAKECQHRVFIVAIGSSPAETHLQRLASATGGHCDFVAPGEDVEPAVLRMSDRMRSPRASGLRVEWPSNFHLRWEQPVQGHAYEQDMFHLSAFIETPQSTEDLGVVKLWGQIEGREGETLLAQAKLSMSESSINTVARLTGYAQYQALKDLPIQPKEEKAAGAQIAETYQLVTEETNFILVHERAEGEKPVEMPQEHKVAQMHAAGQGAVGSVTRSHASAVRRSKSTVGDWDDVPIPMPAFSQKQVDSSMAQFSRPAVWASGRGTPKFDALASLSASSFEDVEIPAFLRRAEGDTQRRQLSNVRQNIDRSNPRFWSDDSSRKGKPFMAGSSGGYVGITPAGLAEWLAINDKRFWPTSYADLVDIGLGPVICEWLEFAIGEGKVEAQVVAAFVQVICNLAAMNFQVPQSKPAGASSSGLAAIEEAILADLRGTKPQSWSPQVENFPAEIEA